MNAFFQIHDFLWAKEPWNRRDSKAPSLIIGAQILRKLLFELYEKGCRVLRQPFIVGSLDHAYGTIFALGLSGGVVSGLELGGVLFRLGVVLTVWPMTLLQQPGPRRDGAHLP